MAESRQIIAIFSQHLLLALTAGGLMQMWHRMADVFGPWYEQIHHHCLDSGVLHAVLMTIYRTLKKRGLDPLVVAVEGCFAPMLQQGSCRHFQRKSLHEAEVLPPFLLNTRR